MLVTMVVVGAILVAINQPSEQEKLEMKKLEVCKGILENYGSQVDLAEEALLMGDESSYQEMVVGVDETISWYIGNGCPGAEHLVRLAP